MNYLLSFSPWIVVSLGHRFGDGKAAVLIAAALAVAIAATNVARHRVRVLEIGGAILFVFVAAIVYAQNGSGLQNWLPAILHGGAAIIAWSSLAVGRPFTIDYAREMTPRQYWGNPLFEQINYKSTLAFALSFTAACGLTALAIANNDHRLATLVWIAMIGVPLLYTKRLLEASKATT
jgi:hypothetical protein